MVRQGRPVKRERKDWMRRTEKRVVCCGRGVAVDFVDDGRGIPAVRGLRGRGGGGGGRARQEIL